MPTYTVNVGIDTSNKRFEAGDTATDKDIPAKDIKWLLDQEIISIGEGKKPPKVKINKVEAPEEEDGE